MSYESQRKVSRLPITLKDPHATRSSDFVSGSSTGKGTRRDVVCSLPLEVWSIGVDIPPHEATPEPRANLKWERDLLRVQHADSSNLFELHLKKGSLGIVQYADVKVRNTPSGEICLLSSRRNLRPRSPLFRFSRWGRPLYNARRLTDSS